MSVRDTDNRLVRKVASGLEALGRRHPWSHNDHFHGWLLRRLPRGRVAALDVGCGQGGLLARLASRFEHVHGTDLDATMRADARARCAGLGNVTVGAEQLADLAGPYDVVTMVASLHHLDARDALGEVRRLLGPGGRLLVIGLAATAGATDEALDIVSGLAGPVVGFVKHPRVNRDPVLPPFPVKDPEQSFDELRAIVREVLPGAVMRRRLFFRYTLEWTAATVAR